MSPRLQLYPRWLCCLVALFAPWSSVSVGSATVHSPPNTPATVEAQAKFFQDFFSVQLSPYKMEFGHVCEDPNTWEQRYEKKDFKNHRDMGKVRWGDKHGGYGEHYWDLNHAGNAHNHGDDGDDGSYNAHDDSYHGNDGSYPGNDGTYHGNDGTYSVHDNEDPYDEPSEQQNTYNDNYNPEKAAKYDEANRAKRAHPKVKAEKKEEEEVKTLKRKIKDDKNKAKPEPEKTEKPKESYNYDPVKYGYKPKEIDYNEEQETYAPKKDVVTEPEKEYVPYEDGAGVRQHYQAEVAAASAPRLFLEHATGRVIDRATGQAYILQPIAVNYQ